jgi:hypothetical protein
MKVEYPSKQRPFPIRTVRWDGDGLQKSFSDATALDFSQEPSIVNQSDKDATDLNRIIARYKGEIAELPHKEGIYADVSSIGDFREVRERLRHFNDYFSDLPAQVREKFNNDPANLAESLNDPNQLDLLSELGIIKGAGGDPGSEKPLESPPASPTA